VKGKEKQVNGKVKFKRYKRGKTMRIKKILNQVAKS